MPPCGEPSVHSQGPISEGNQGGGSLTRPVGRRRILVQTDTGNVYGMECDRADNVQAVKKRLQALLQVPMDQVALVCGDLTLKNDLSELKKDTPVLLTRMLQRSLSTPCLSPALNFLAEAGSSHVLEVVGGLLCSSKMRVIVKEIAKAVECGVEPVPITGGLGGAYYFRNSKGESVAIVKPTDEEPLAPNNPKGFVGKVLGHPGLKKSIRVGETGVREVAAYLLDHESFAKVPPTVLVKITHRVFHVNTVLGVPRPSVTKLASCQEFVFHDFDANELGCSGFTVPAVHRIGILDIRIFNTDRHAGNILVKKVERPGTWGSSRMHVNNTLELIPIDHGLCLPEFLEDPYFEWLHWPQASLAFSDEELDYIHRLDAKKDAEMLRRELPMLRMACLRVLILSTTFLKKAAAAGFCLAEIGALMSRDGLEEASQLEVFCVKARREAQSEILNGMPEDDDFFPDNPSEGDDSQEQFVFEEDEELCEGTSLETLPHTQNDYSRWHLAGHPKCSDLQAPSLTHKEKSLASTGLSADFKRARAGEISGKESSTIRHCFMGESLDAHLKFPCEALSLETEDFTLSLPAKQRTCYANGGRVMSRAFFISGSSGRSFSKGAQLNDSPAATRMDACAISRVPVQAMSYKSASLSDRKPRSNFIVDRGTFGVSASETHRMANVAGSVSAFSFEYMTEQEWACFMDCFERVLQNDFESRCAGYRQRLGISLPAVRQTHFHY